MVCVRVTVWYGTIPYHTIMTGLNSHICQLTCTRKQNREVCARPIFVKPSRQKSVRLNYTRYIVYAIHTTGREESILCYITNMPKYYIIELLAFDVLVQNFRSSDTFKSITVRRNATYYRGQREKVKRELGDTQNSSQQIITFLWERFLT